MHKCINCSLITIICFLRSFIVFLIFCDNSYQPLVTIFCQIIIKNCRVRTIRSKRLKRPAAPFIIRDLAGTLDCTFLKGFAHICVANCALSLHIFVYCCSVCLAVAARCRRDQKISGPSNSIKPANYHSSRICSAMTISTSFRHNVCPGVLSCV